MAPASAPACEMDGCERPGVRAAASAWLVAVGVLLALVASGESAPAAAQAPSEQALTETGCFDPTKGDADYEAYGPTDVNAQAGDGRVTVGENDAGTITVFKYPNPSFYNQVKYLAVSRDASGRVQVQFPNEGSFAGIVWRTRGGASGFAWLRDWRATQRYDSPDTPVPVTSWSAPGALGLTVTASDLAIGSSFVRELWIRRGHRSPVTSASLVWFENFNPIATRIQYLPITDWCLSQLSDQHAEWDGAARAIVHSWSGTDAATRQPASAAFAFGFDRGAPEHQVGSDGRDPAARSGPADGYDQIAEPPHRLGGGSAADGQVTGTLALPLRFDRRGLASARLIVGAGADRAGALAALAAARSSSYAHEMNATRRDWHAWLARTQLPASGDPRVVNVAKRSLITVRLAIVPGTGAIVASADTQGPYGEDWIRDGAFINELLDDQGFTATVTAHDLFYARVQTSPDNPSTVRPPGNWAMAYYGDGVDGAPIPWEIDETGLGIWTLWSHAARLGGGERADYLARVYPSIARAADFLAACQDPLSGLQCPASEDDNYTPSQSLHGAETVWLGLRSALAAAAAKGDTRPQVAAWRARLDRLDQAIAALYDPTTRSYSEGSSSGNAYNVDYGDGGWLLWPVAFRAYGDPTMRGEADAVRRSLERSLAADHGEYEAKALLGLAYAWQDPTPQQAAELRGALSHMARSLTTSTGLFGEAWRRFAGGLTRPVQDMPHVWEHTLFYLAALRIDGGRPYRFAPGDVWRTACRHRAAPPGACR